MWVFWGAKRLETLPGKEAGKFLMPEKNSTLPKHLKREEKRGKKGRWERRGEAAQNVSSWWRNSNIWSRLILGNKRNVSVKIAARREIEAFPSRCVETGRVLLCQKSFLTGFFSSLHPPERGLIESSTLLQEVFMMGKPPFLSIKLLLLGIPEQLEIHGQVMGMIKSPWRRQSWKIFGLEHTGFCPQPPPKSRIQA